MMAEIECFGDKMGDESEKDKTEDNENEERIELIYNIIQDQFRLFWDNKNTLDKKASNVIIFSGIVISIFSGIVGILLKNLSETQGFYLYINSYLWLSLIFIIGTVLLICSIVYALRAYSLRKWTLAPDPQRLLDGYAKTNKSKSEILKSVSATIAQTITDNEKEVDDKVNSIKISFKLLQFGMVFYAAWIICIVLIYIGGEA